MYFTKLRIIAYFPFPLDIAQVRYKGLPVAYVRLFSCRCRSYYYVYCRRVPFSSLMHRNRVGDKIFSLKRDFGIKSNAIFYYTNIREASMKR